MALLSKLSLYSKDPQRIRGHTRKNLLLQLHYYSLSKGCFCRLKNQCTLIPISILHLKICLVRRIQIQKNYFCNLMLQNIWYYLSLSIDHRSKQTRQVRLPCIRHQRITVPHHNRQQKYMHHLLQLELHPYLRTSCLHYNTNWNCCIYQRNYRHQCTLHRRGLAGNSLLCRLVQAHSFR